MPAYVRYSEGVESIPPDEAEALREVVRIERELGALAFERRRHGLRSAHAKSHGVLKGELRVPGDLPEELAQGVFQRGRAYPAVVRLSTSPGDVLPDGMPSFRGFAIKLLGVPGERLGRPDEPPNQDLLLANHPTFPAGTLGKYLRESRLLAPAARLSAPVQKAGGLVARAANAVAERLGTELVGSVGLGKRETGLLDVDYSSMAAMRHGDYVAKLGLFPVSPGLRALRDEAFALDDNSGLKDLVRAFFASSGAEYELRAQLCTSLDRMPVEDASVRWDESESPFRPLARLVLPPQESYSPARRVYADDVLSFSPWNGVAAHRPLGGLQRARRVAYEASSIHRHDTNVRPRVEPTSIDELPD